MCNDGYDDYRNRDQREPEPDLYALRSQSYGGRAFGIASALIYPPGNHATNDGRTWRCGEGDIRSALNS
jgi:hypothetical protein